MLEAEIDSLLTYMRMRECVGDFLRLVGWCVVKRGVGSSNDAILLTQADL